MCLNKVGPGKASGKSGISPSTSFYSQWSSLSAFVVPPQKGVILITGYKVGHKNLEG